MAQQNQAIIPVDPASSPLRRKRGRPRKHDGPGYEPHRRNRQFQATASQAIPNRAPSSHANLTANSSHEPCGLIGQKVFGTLEGIFDAGFLLSVRVGETGPVLKGLVFDPELSVPITVDNDIAPLLPMSRSGIVHPVHRVPTKEPVSLPIRPAAKVVTAAVPLRIREPVTPFPPVNHLHESSRLPQSAPGTKEAERNDATHLPQDVHPASQTDLKKIRLETAPKTEEVAGHGAHHLPQDMPALQTDAEIIHLERARSTKVAQKDAGPALQTDFKNILLETLSRKVANDDLPKSQSAASQQSVPTCTQTGLSSGPSYVMNHAVPAAIGACSGDRTEKMVEAAKRCENSVHIEGSSGNVSMIEQSDKALTADVSSGGKLNCTGQAPQLDKSLTDNETVGGNADVSCRALISDENLIAHEMVGGKMDLVGEAPQLNIQVSEKRQLQNEDQRNLSVPSTPEAVASQVQTEERKL